MPPCHCKFRNCNGAEIPRSTVRNHAIKDRALSHTALTLPIQLALSQPTTNPQVISTHPTVSEAAPYSPALDTNGNSPEPETLSLPACDSVREAEVRVREAEERGRSYMEVMHGAVEAIDDIGDLGEDEDGDEDEDGVDEAVEPTAAVGGNGVGLPTYQIPENGLRLHSPPPADPRFPGENTPDPFWIPYSPITGASVTLNNCHSSVFQLYLLVAWLHTQCKLAFTACSAVLVVVFHIIAALGVVLDPNHHTPLVSLSSVMNNIGIEPTFSVLPVCPNCLEPYPHNRVTLSLSCNRCDALLFRPVQQHRRCSASTGTISRALLQYPMMSIEAQLRAMLAVRGMEHQLESWRHLQRKPEELQDIFDGEVTRGLKGSDGQPFFENPLPLNSHELRIGLVLGLDW
jgi:hypothetical protein